jgi:hypothetical protein
MTMERTAEELARDRVLDEAQREQERLHAADPYQVPLYVPADAEGLQDESYTAGWQEEPGA